MSDCPNCEYHKKRAQIWRHQAYKLGGKPLPWEPWVGLEDEDVATVKNEFNRGALWAEAKLKEKNGG